MRHVAFLTSLFLALSMGMAQADEQTPASANTAAVESLDDWVAQAAAFRDSLRHMARLWSSDDAPLLEERTDIFEFEIEAFSELTHHTSGALRDSDAAQALDSLADQVRDRLNELHDARSHDARAVVDVLRGMDRLVRERSSSFIAEEELHAGSAAPIRINYVTPPRY